jgi:hypothetical protein
LIHEGVHPKRISERLGHSSIKLTMDTYGHLFDGSDRDSAEKMERLFGAGARLDEKEQRSARSKRVSLRWLGRHGKVARPHGVRRDGLDRFPPEPHQSRVPEPDQPEPERV